MAITHLIAHHIRRPSPSDKATSQLRQEEFELNGLLEESLREMKLGFMKKLTKIHGQFSSDTGEHPVSEWLRQHQEGKSGFVSFTHRCMEQFEQILSQSDAVIDAYVFFVIEKFEHTDELYLYIVHNKAGLYLDSQLNVTNAVIFDAENISLAAKVNLREWQDQDAQLSYLSLLVWRGEKEINDSFMQWIGFTNKANIKEQTDAFIEIVENYTQNKPVEQALETKEKFVSYCLEEDKAGRKVNLQDLSSHINESDQKEFAQFVKQQQPEFKENIIPDRSQLRQYIRISGRNELLSMSFDSKCLGESIIYDADNDSITIKSIPNGLKSRLLKHMKEK